MESCNWDGLKKKKSSLNKSTSIFKLGLSLTSTACLNHTFKHTLTLCSGRIVKDLKKEEL